MQDLGFPHALRSRFHSARPFS